MIRFEFVDKISQDVKPEIAAHIASEFLEWLDKKGYHLEWGNEGRLEPLTDDDDQMGYDVLARAFIADRGEQ